MRKQSSYRAGRFVRQLEGYQAFQPAILPPDPDIVLDAELQKLLSAADRALGRLDGASELLPNPDLFVAMYVQHEAVLSSQIEGTQSTLEDVLAFDSGAEMPDQPKDVEEVVNYVAAMNHGLSRLKEIPLSIRLIKEIHAHLMRGVRGGEKNPGEFRRSQNWIGGNSPMDAAFVPPPAHEMHEAMTNLERYLHDRDVPELILAGMAHAQFETIHPFLDGNGRVGRLLITLLLCERTILKRPLLYLSYYLKAHRTEYYDRLTAIRLDGDWEGWLKFFLRGVFQVSQAATATARGIVEFRESHRAKIQLTAAGSNGLKLLDVLYQRPWLSISAAQQALECSYATAARVMGELEELGIVREMTGNKRNRRFGYTDYIALFQQQALEIDGE